MQTTESRFENCLTGLRADATKVNYRYGINWVLDGKPDEFLALAKKDREEAESLIISFIRAKRGKVASATVVNPVNAVKSFLEYYEVQLNWKKLRRELPAHRKIALDRGPTVEEIRKLFSVCDLAPAQSLTQNPARGVPELVLDVDWAMVSAWAAMVTATGAIVAVWLQNRHARITRSLDVLLRLEGKFDSDRMKDLRRKAATGFLAGKFVDEAYYVLDFFEEAGLLLQMKAIHEEILFESFYHSPPAYWYTAKKYILEMRRTSKELYDNLEYLAERDLDYASKKTGESTDKMKDGAYWKDFIVRETQAS